MTLPPRTSTRIAALVVAAVAASTSLAGCGGNGLQVSSSGRASGAPSPTGGASPTPSATSSPTTPPSSGATTSGTSTSGTSTGPSTPGTPGTCTVADLRVSLQSQGAAAGSAYSLLDFRNTSSTTCTLDGHPGVSFVGRHDGTQIGQPAVRTGSVSAVTLAPGESTSALLQVANAGNYPTDACAPTTVDGLRVYPPDSRASVFVAFKTQACQRPTTQSPQLQVSAVGYHG